MSRLNYLPSFLIIILCTISSYKFTQTESKLNITGAYKVTSEKQTNDIVTHESTKEEKQHFEQKKLKMEKVSGLVANSSQSDLQNFIEGKIEAIINNEKDLNERENYEKKLDAYIMNYLIKNQMLNKVSSSGNVKVMKEFKYKKNGKDIFYDPNFNKFVWDKISILIEKNEFTEDSQAYHFVNEDFLKDKVLENFTIIQKTTWFVFKFSRFMPDWTETLSVINNVEFKFLLMMWGTRIY